MSADSTLELILGEILAEITPSEEDRLKRNQVLDELRADVRYVESLRGATVKPFGSFVSNLFTRWGDLDISIDLPSVGKMQERPLLYDLRNTLTMLGGWSNLEYIGAAKVPILKLDSKNLSISCDVSINNLGGQMKSRLLFLISKIDDRFHDLVLLVKEWAKLHGINDSVAGTLNSYCLSLLVIFHFQTCEPALLPPLEKIYPRNVVDDLTDRYIEDICVQNITKFLSDKSRQRNGSSLSELFVSFLTKFSDISSRDSEQEICPYTGQRIRRMIHFPKSYALVVEDPFERSSNAARTVKKEQLTKISKAFEETYSMVSSGNVNPRSIIAKLVRPEVSQVVSRKLLNNLRGYGRTYPQIHRAVQSSTPAQLKYQDTRIYRRPTNITAKEPDYQLYSERQRSKPVTSSGRSAYDMVGPSSPEESSSSAGTGKKLAVMAGLVAGIGALGWYVGSRSDDDEDRKT